MTPWTIDLEFDDDGYPTDRCLDDLRSAPLDFISGAHFVAEVLTSDRIPYRLGSFQDGVDGFSEMPVRFVNFSTGGWSGNESLIGTALSRVDVKHYLKQWNAGGHYQFQVPLAFLEDEATA